MYKLYKLYCIIWSRDKKHSQIEYPKAQKLEFFKFLDISSQTQFAFI